MGQFIPKCRVVAALTLLACCGFSPRAHARSKQSSLTTVAAVADREISRAPYGVPVRLRAQVTFVDPEWRLLFVRDTTGSIFVELPAKISGLNAGDLVEVNGVTAPGDVGSNIERPTIHWIEARPLAPPRKLSLAAIEAGMADSQYVITEGVIRPGPPIWNHTSLTLVDGDVSAPIVIPGGVSRAAEALIGGRALVRGVAAVRLDSANKPVGYQLFVQSLRRIAPETPHAQDPFSVAVEPISAIRNCNLTDRFLPPVHIRGQVLWEGAYELVLGDYSGTVRVHFADSAGAKPGAVLDLVGFPGLEENSVVLRDSLIHVLGGHGPPGAAPVSLSVREALRSGRDGEAVRMGGRVLSEHARGNDQHITVDDRGRKFELLVFGSSSSGLFVTLTPGSLIEASGILRRIHYRDRHSDSIQLLVGSPSEIVIRTSKPINWHLIAILLIAGIFSAVLLWNAQLRRTVRSKMALLRKQLDHEAHLEDRYRRLVHRNLAAVFSWRPSGEIIDCNPAFARMLGYSSPEQVIGKSYWSLLSGDSREAITDALETGSANGIETSLTREDGSAIYVLENITLVHEPEGEWYETTALDVTQSRLDHFELQRARDAARQEAEIDALTGLPNRRRFSQLVQQHFENAAVERGKLALLYLDLDGFKEINDSSGHATGDLLLQKVAARLQLVLKDGDQLCRLGGDEFAIVLTRCESVGNSKRVAESLLTALRNSFSIGGQELHVSASVGISAYPEASDYTSLLQQADSAMYVAKRAGRNRVAFYTPEIGNAVRERSRILAELKGAVNRGEILLQYQPQFRLDRRQIVRFEALARWNSRALGNVAPGRFIPVAEETGLISELGAQILEYACRQAVEWQRRTGQAIPVAVNISTAQLRVDSFADEILQTLARTGLPSHLLELEMTESIMLEDMQKCREMLVRLRSAGVLLALDDFGTGYSSLSYLPDLPFDRIKIARAFIEKMHHGRGGETLIRTVVSVAHTLQMGVVAEGIETEKELRLMKAFGVDEVQGYLLGKPVSDPCTAIERTVVEPSWSVAEQAVLNRTLTVTTI